VSHRDGGVGDFPATRPNILLLMADQHRHDVIGAAGHPVVQTPNLDRLTGEGVRFSRAYCQGPLCMPARVSVLTERYVRDHGVFGIRTEADPAWPTFVQTLRDAGYHTTCIGKMHFYLHDRDGNTADHADQIAAHGFTENIETVGKLASRRLESPYTDYLRSEGLFETYRDFIGVSRYSDSVVAGQRVERLPLWHTESIPLPADAYIDAWHGRRTARWIDEYEDDKPFFCWLGFPGPHDPWDAPAEYVDRYREADIALDSTVRPTVRPDTSFGTFLDFQLNTFVGTDDLSDERIRDVCRYYYANVTVIDDAVGRILDALDRRGMLENTWIVYTSDHGEMLGAHGLLSKMVFYEPSVLVPLLIRPPGGTTKQVVDVPVEHVDVSTTLRAVGGAGELPGSEGRSLLDLISGGAASSREVVHTENLGFGAFVTDRYKLVVDEDDVAPAQLFDLVEDPEEDRDIVDDPAYVRVVDELMARHARPFFSTPPARPEPSFSQLFAELQAWRAATEANGPEGGRT